MAGNIESYRRAAENAYDIAFNDRELSEESEYQASVYVTEEIEGQARAALSAGQINADDVTDAAIYEHIAVAEIAKRNLALVAYLSGLTLTIAGAENLTDVEQEAVHIEVINAIARRMTYVVTPGDDEYLPEISFETVFMV